MAGLQDLPVRLSEILELSPAEALRFAARAVPVILLESIVDVPSTRVGGLIGALSFGGDRIGPSAVLISHEQLLNPPGSGVDVFVDKLIFSRGAAGVADLRRLDAPLATLETTKAFQDFRRRGDPAAEIRSENNAAVLGTRLAEIEVLAATPFELTFDEVVLGEGQGIAIEAAAMNVSMTTLWFWREILS